MQTFTQYTKPKRGYMAYHLSSGDRTALLHHFKPKFSEVICEHVTYKFPAMSDDPLPPVAHTAHVIGYAHEDGLETLVVEINGSTHRSDGGTFHLTLSLDRSKKKPKDSNELIKHGFEKVHPIPIHLEPTFLF